MVMPTVFVKELRRTYGFEEVAIVPGDVTTNPELSTTDFTVGGYRFSIPILASAMDAIVSPAFAGLIARAGGLAVMNLEGVYCRYDDAQDAIDEVSQAPAASVTEVMQRVYSAPLREELVARRVGETIAAGAVCAVSFTPQNAKRLAPAAVEAGAQIIVVQSTVTTARHISNSYMGLRFSDLKRMVDVPLLVGNTVTGSASLELMEQGIDGIMVGVGPGPHARRATSPAWACPRSPRPSSAPPPATSTSRAPGATSPSSPTAASVREAISARRSPPAPTPS